MKSLKRPGVRHLGAVIAALAVACVASTALAKTIYVDGVTGNDTWDGLSEEWNGTSGPKKTIQAGITVASNGDDVSIADAVYSGPGNYNVVFSGKEINVHSKNGPANCIIDIANLEQPVFRFLSAEPPACILDGLTIINCGAC
jgi:hypothetical protein